MSLPQVVSNRRSPMFLDGLMYRTDITLKVVDNALLNYNGKLLFLRFNLRSDLSARVNGAYIELLKGTIQYLGWCCVVKIFQILKIIRTVLNKGRRPHRRGTELNDSMSIPLIFRYYISLTVSDGFLINKSQITVM